MGKPFNCQRTDMGSKPEGVLPSLASWVAAAVLSAAIVFPFHPPFRTGAQGYEFDAVVSSSQRGIVQLYYDIGRGFNEADSSTAPIRAGEEPKLFHLRLPLGRYGALRFDPLDGAGVITVSDAVIRDENGREVVRFPPSAFEATQQIRKMTVGGETLTIETTPGAYDPNTIIRLEKPLMLSAPPYREWIRFIGWFSAVFAVLAAALAAASRLFRGCTELLLKAAVRRPKAALALTALAALLANSYPVIFFGKSFVSPNNGVLLLYEDIPTLPGYKSETTENQMGSDVAAVMLWHIPTSRVQHQAIFHDGELPLWNRYDLCGQALLGQGQSMIGDPLHMATAVLSNGSALAWDIKYLIAKWLFAFGMGLTVLALTDSLGVAMLLSASSLFIGFFSYRLNHPAIFSLCYSPWIIYSWVRIAGARNASQAFAWTAALFASDWMEINSGTVKEAYILASWLNAAGFLALLLNHDSRSLKLRKAILAAWAAILFILISAPIWLTFLDTLGSSSSSHNPPEALQIPAHRLLGFFEDLFYRQAAPQEIQVAPSTNFLVLLGILWALSRLGKLSGNRMCLALGLSSVIPIALVYGILPRAAIVAVPFLGAIRHIHNTFSCVLIILAIPLAGFGLNEGLDSLRDKAWWPRFGVVLLLMGALLGLYFVGDRHLPWSTFFVGYTPTLIAAFVLLQIAAWYRATRGAARLGACLLVVGCLLAIHWRHGQYLKTAFDNYDFNPQDRVDFDAESPAVQYTEHTKPDPSRTLGLSLNLFPGFNATYLVEDIFGIEALRSQEYQQLLEGLGLARVTLFTSVQPNESSGAFQAAYDALNVSYFLGSNKAVSDEIKGWDKVRSLDLTIYKSSTFWPRAFYVDRLEHYDQLADLVTRVQRAAGLPFAAVQDVDIPGLPKDALHPSGAPATGVVAASNYALTNNTTSFDVEAPRAGIVVLSETWLKDDFKATINGKRVPYFRVNHAFKGIYLDSGGSYRVCFSYWPRHFTLSLVVSAFGALLACVSCLLAFTRFRPHLASPKLEKIPGTH